MTDEYEKAHKRCWFVCAVRSGVFFQGSYVAVTVRSLLRNVLDGAMGSESL
jgi:hypothetical protein